MKAQRKQIKYLLYLTLVFLVSCKGNPGNKVNKPKSNGNMPQPVFEPGKIHTIHCKQDTANTYTLFLPSTYSPDREFPVIFFFDAHKRGKLPVKKYKELAEKYGYILSGSNNSSNGQSQSEHFIIANTMMNDVMNRFKVDRERIYTSGFSGGARVASGIALYEGGVAGVIACAAGFPALDGNYNDDFAFLGIVGNEDFNYMEMKNLDNVLDTWKTYNYLLVYNGKHDWPPYRIMEQGIMFMEFDAVRRRGSTADPETVSGFISLVNDERETARKENDLAALYETDRKATLFLQGIEESPEYGNEVKELVKNPRFIVRQDEIAKLENKEAGMQQMFLRSFGVKSRQWWKNQMSSLINLSLKSTNRYEVNMYKRVLNYLSLVSYLSAKNALDKSLPDEAGKYLMIYEMADPGNPEVYYLKASYYMLTGNNDSALKMLSKAAEKGFSGYERLKNAANFKPLMNDDGFEEILKAVKRNFLNNENS